MPGKNPNEVKLASKGTLPVAVLGSEDLDVTQIDQTTLKLEGVSPKPKGKSSKVGTLRDVNGDSFVDLVLHFDLKDLEIDKDTTELTLEGKMKDGTEFIGTDSISPK